MSTQKASMILGLKTFVMNFNSEVENKTFYYSDILIFNKYNCMNKKVF